MVLTIILGVLFTMLGFVFASFFGVVISRVPNNESIVRPASHCDSCGHTLKWYENIPILSFIFLKGKCKECGAKIPVFFFIYEILGGLFICLTYVQFGLSINFLFASLIVLILLLIGGYDFKTNTILDIFWIIFLALTIGFDVYRIVVLHYVWWHFLVGAGALGGFFLLLKVVFYLIKKEDVLGTGDVIFMAVAGLLLGYKTILIAVLVASILGCIIELSLIAAKKKDKESPIPFCPYLALGVFVAMVYGERIINLVIGG